MGGWGGRTTTSRSRRKRRRRYRFQLARLPFCRRQGFRSRRRRRHFRFVIPRPSRKRAFAFLFRSFATAAVAAAPAVRPPLDVGVHLRPIPNPPFPLGPLRVPYRPYDAPYHFRRHGALTQVVLDRRRNVPELEVVASDEPQQDAVAGKQFDVERREGVYPNDSVVRGRYRTVLTYVDRSTEDQARVPVRQEVPPSFHDGVSVRQRTVSTE
mmetsp:Transcript_50747/g.93817  ORF Transcript_50747/g.93817 Transcript_50747/m.93817 type:complete len:211 (-) Transcript_50747:59-691(-)